MNNTAQIPGSWNPRNLGSWDPRIPGTPDPGILGSQGPRILASRDPGIPGPGDPGIPGSRDPRIPGSRDPRILGSQDPRILGSQDPRIPGSRDPRIPGSWDPGIPDPALDPGIPRSRGTIFAEGLFLWNLQYLGGRRSLKMILHVFNARCPRVFRAPDDRFDRSADRSIGSIDRSIRSIFGRARLKKDIGEIEICLLSDFRPPVTLGGRNLA